MSKLGGHMTTIRHSKEEKYMVEELKPMLENISGKKLDELCDDECLFPESMQ